MSAATSPQDLNVSLFPEGMEDDVDMDPMVVSAGEVISGAEIFSDVPVMKGGAFGGSVAGSGLL
jgi:hypothetical protein